MRNEVKTTNEKLINSNVGRDSSPKTDNISHKQLSMKLEKEGPFDRTYQEVIARIDNDYPSGGKM